MKFETVAGTRLSDEEEVELAGYRGYRSKRTFAGGTEVVDTRTVRGEQLRARKKLKQEVFEIFSAAAPMQKQLQAAMGLMDPDKAAQLKATMSTLLSAYATEKAKILSCASVDELACTDFAQHVRAAQLPGGVS